MAVRATRFRAALHSDLNGAGERRAKIIVVNIVYPIFVQTKKANPFGSASKPRVMRVCLVDATGLEPATPTMSRWCSNQLSYASAMEAHSTEKRLCVNTFITNPLKLRHFYRSEQRFIFRTGG